MFLGWDVVPRKGLEDAQISILKKRLTYLAFDQPLMRCPYPRYLAVDTWTNSILLSISSTTIVLQRIDESISSESSINEQTLDAAWYPFDSGLFVTSSLDKIQLWDSQRLKAVRSINLAGRCNQVAFSNFPSVASTLAVATNHGEIRLVDIASGSSAHTLMSGIDADINALCWSPRDSHILATGGADSRVLIWDVRKLNGFLFALDEHSSQHSARTEWVESQQRNAQNHQVRTSLSHSRAAVTSITFLENGRLLLSTGSDGSVRLWQEGMLIHRYFNTYVSFSRRVSGQWGTLGFHLCHSKQTNIMFVSNAVSDNLIDCVDMITGKVIRTLSAHVRKVRCLAYGEEGGDPELYSAGDDGFVLKWRAKTPIEGSNQPNDEDYWSS